MKTSIIIPTYNKYHRLKYTLKYLLSQNSQPSNCELIVVHDGCDDSKELLAEYENRWQIKYIHSEHPMGRSQARNTGVEHANGELLIFIDDDLIVEEGFIEAHQTLHRHNPNIVVHGAVLTYFLCRFMVDPATGELDSSFIKSDAVKAKRPIRDEMIFPYDVPLSDGFNQASVKARYDYMEKQILKMTDPSSLLIDGPFAWLACTTRNLSLRKNLFEAVGGFDTSFEHLWGMEDLEFGYRLFTQSPHQLDMVYGIKPKGIHLAHARVDADDQFLLGLDIFADKFPNDRSKILALKRLLVERTVDATTLSNRFR